MGCFTSEADYLNSGHLVHVLILSFSFLRFHILLNKARTAVRPFILTPCLLAYRLPP